MSDNAEIKSYYSPNGLGYTSVLKDVTSGIITYFIGGIYNSLSVLYLEKHSELTLISGFSMEFNMCLSFYLLLSYNGQW